MRLHSPPIFSAAALRTRKPGSSASEMSSGTTNWQHSSLVTTGASAPSSCVATTRFSSASLSCARQSTAVSTVCPTSCDGSSCASSISAADAASSTCETPAALRSCELPELSSVMSRGTISSVATLCAVRFVPAREIAAHLRAEAAGGQGAAGGARTVVALAADFRLVEQHLGDAH